MTYKVTYGIETQSKECINAPNIGQVKQDTVLRAILGYGDNVRALVHGVEQPDHAIVPDGADIHLETRANTKAN